MNDIADKVKKSRDNIKNVVNNINKTLDIKSPGEVSPEEEDAQSAEELPDAPSAEKDIISDLPAEEELDDIDEIISGLGETPEETPSDGEKPPEVPTALPEIKGDTTEAPGKPIEKVPQKREWMPVETKDAKNLRFQSNKEKVMLDIRMLSLDPKVWLARLQKDGKLLDWGTVLIPRNIEDPVKYIQTIADTMLDAKSMRYETEWQKRYIK